LLSLPDTEFCEFLHRRYAASAALLSDVQLRSLVLPSLRADFEALETYAHRERGPVRVPITVLRGRTDQTLSAQDAAAWRQVTSLGVTVLEVDAGHFFIDSHRDWVLAQVAIALRCAR